jgi:hypothetical protein
MFFVELLKTIDDSNQFVNQYSATNVVESPLMYWIIETQLLCDNVVYAYETGLDTSIGNPPQKMRNVRDVCNSIRIIEKVSTTTGRLNKIDTSN